MSRSPRGARFAGQEIRLSGKNLTENEHVKLGAHHTLQLEPHRPFQLSKAAWDGLDLARIREACDPSVSADLAVVLITASTSNTPALAAQWPCQWWR